MQLKCEDCVERDLRKAEEEEKLREKDNDSEPSQPCKKITKVAAQRSEK